MTRAANACTLLASLQDGYLLYLELAAGCGMPAHAPKHLSLAGSIFQVCMLRSTHTRPPTHAWTGNNVSESCVLVMQS